MEDTKSTLNYLHFFPYPSFRKDQERIIKQIEECIREKAHILLEAPNGTGKTIIALSAALPVIFENNLKIIYLCRTHAQNARVIKELNKINEDTQRNNKHLKINALSIRGRSEMCLNKMVNELNLPPQESALVCEDLRKEGKCVYYNNLDIFKSMIIEDENLFNRPIDADEIIEFAKQRNLCPYFLCKSLLEKMKVIVCNYQWVYHPSIKPLFFMFLGTGLENCILIQDECHNLIDVATEANSEKLIPYNLANCLTDLNDYKGKEKYKDFIKYLQDIFNSKKEKLKEGETRVDADKSFKEILIITKLANIEEFKEFLYELLSFSEYVKEKKVEKEIVSRDHLGIFAKFWLKWIKVYKLDSYFICYKKEIIKQRTYISLEINALDPREISVPIIDKAYSTISLTGTIIPDVFKNLMGFNQINKNFNHIIAESPFPKENIRAFITEKVDTKMAHRKPYMFQKMISKIEELIHHTPANVGIFCASYEILNSLIEYGIEKVVEKTGKKFFFESSEMKASKNALMLKDFKSVSSTPYEGGVLLGVCGGRNSEGEDYPGNYMNAVIIAGFPYHMQTPLVKEKIKYYDKKFNKQGWDYAYLFPAIQRANQASGRPIRKITDKGCIVFLDSRFREKKEWISHWLKNLIEILPDQPEMISKKLKSFWNY